MSEEKIELSEGIRSILGQIIILDEEPDWEAAMISEAGIDYCIAFVNFEKPILINKHLFTAIQPDTLLGVLPEGENLRIFRCPQELKKNVN